MKNSNLQIAHAQNTREFFHIHPRLAIMLILASDALESEVLGSILNGGGGGGGGNILLLGFSVFR